MTAKSVRLEDQSSRQRMLAAAKTLFAAEGDEQASTAAIARRAHTSESQLIKHFGNKRGLLQDILEWGWSSILAEARASIVARRSPREKLQAIGQIFFSRLDKDPELKILLLLEGRRIRTPGRQANLTAGFLSFVALLDEIIGESRRQQCFRPGLHPLVVRSALMGMLEAVLRDQMLAQTIQYPATFSSRDISGLLAATLDFFFPPAERSKSKLQPVVETVRAR